MRQQATPIEKRVLQAASAAGFLICVAVAVWGWQTGVLTSQDKLQELVGKWGPAGALLFTVFQAARFPISRRGQAPIRRPAFFLLQFPAICAIID